MAPSFDCTALLCAEDSLLCLDESDIGDDDFIVSKDVKTNQNQGFFNGDEGFFVMRLPLLSEECVVLMVEVESDHLPRDDYLIRLRKGDLDSKIRREAIDWIGKVQAHYGFGPLCAYLSVNYLDRFLSAYQLPRGKAWMMQLLAVACLSLAAKVEETDVPLCLDLQVCESKYVFEAKTIQRMELLVLSTLKWRMQPTTPFYLIDYFLWKMNYDQPPPKSSITRSIELISNTNKGIDFLEFRPSEIAAAVAMSALRETKTIFNIDKAISCFIQHVKKVKKFFKERVLKCLQMIKEVSPSVALPSCINGIVKVENSSSLPYVPRSPIGVLDVACLSYKSDEITVGSCANSPHSTPAAKRSKLNNSNPYEVDLKS